MIPPGFADRFPDVSRESFERIDAFVALLLAWQTRINLIAPSTVPDIWERHIADSLQLVYHIPTSRRVVADLGSGAGLPGVVLAACGFHVHLYEANAKKAAFLAEALRVSGGTGEVHRQRIETISNPPPVQAVTARALAPLPELLGLAEPFLAVGAIAYFHKGAEIQAELTETSKYWTITAVKHPSLTDSNAVILEVKEAIRVTA